MQKLFLMMAFLFSLGINAFTSFGQTLPSLTNINHSNKDPYFDGFCEGHCEGYIQAFYDFNESEPNCPPIPKPLAPDPGRTKYKHGYNKGFQVGYILAAQELGRME